LYREKPAPERVVSLFGTNPPQTFEGALLLARAQVTLGRTDAAVATLVPFWRKQKLDARQEMAVLKEFGGIIPLAEHRFRMERMLYEDRIRSAERLAVRVGAE